MKKIVIILALLLGGKIHAQQELLISQYNFDQSIYNPAAVGNNDYFSTSMMFRKQWVSFDGAPTSGFVNIEGPVQKMNFGTGLLVAYDRIGVTDRSDIFASYSYKLRMEEAVLSFGLRAGVNILSVRNLDHNYWDEGDQLLTENMTNVQFNFGFGLHYKYRGFYAGFIMPRMVNYKPNTFMSFSGQHQLERHYYLTTGYKVKAGEKFTVEPSLFARYVPHAPFQMDINVMTLYNKFIGVGLGWRSGDAILASLLMQITDRIRLGYAFDATLTEIRNYSAGAHEIMLSFGLWTKKVPEAKPSLFNTSL